MSQGRRAWFLLAAWSCLLGISRASPPGSGTAVLVQSDLGGAPISGRVGPSGPRISSDLSNPSNLPSPIPDQTRIAAPAPRPTTAAPSYGSFELTTGSEDDGPLDGLTLDQAIERLLKESLDLRGKYYEIPQADADVLNAGLRANPIFYADGQLVPYGSYSRNRPGGQTQYDVNLSIPMDLSHKRQARTVYASSAKRVIEAQYQNAVRVAIDQLYGAFLDVLSARQAVRYSEAGVKGFQQLYHVTLELYRRDQNTRADVYHVQTQLNTSELGLIDARENLRKANRALGVLLNLPPQQAEKLEVRGTIQDLATGPPPLEALVPMGRSPCVPGCGVVSTGHQDRRGQRPPPAGESVLRRVLTLSTLHISGQFTLWREESDLVGPGNDGSSTALQPQPGQHRAGASERGPVTN